jgi:hypothetical protein
LEYGGKLNKRQFAVLLMLVIISSFLGGAIFQIIFGHSNLAAKERAVSLQVIKASQFLLVNKDGRIRASLSLENFGGEGERPALSLYDGNGKSRADFYLGTNDSPQLIFYDKNGRNRFHLGLAAAGNAGMNINNGKSEKLLELDTSSGIPVMTVRGENTMTRWTAP